jgi:predicted lipid-binding transport protein (Tim44 family)
MTVSTAPNSTAAADPYAGDRTGTILGALAGVLGGGAVLYFWIIGAIGLLGRNGGFIQNLQLEGVWRTLFLAYPFVFLVALVAGAALAALKRDLEAVGVLGLPVVAAVLYYLALIHVRPV